MNAFQYLCASAALGTLLSGCGSLPGQPRKGAETPAPNEILEFGTLYAENCAACHGAVCVCCVCVDDYCPPISEFPSWLIGFL